MTIEIQKYKPVNKGVVKCSFSIKILPWGMTINDCCLMEKGTNSWVSFPSRKYEADGETKYWPYVFFEKDVKDKLEHIIKEKVAEAAQAHNGSDLMEDNKSLGLDNSPF